MTYDEFFEVVIAGAAREAGAETPTPYAYQRGLAAGAWPDMLHVPTGLGKTAAVASAWLYRRLGSDPTTPRRLVWCLPMRVLVEQTSSHVDDWLARARPIFEQRGLVPPASFVLMGGEADEGWVRQPEQPAVLIGTQDMLLSRALMRGYGASRYRWPVDFALLHNDALWVFDEVQLMGAGLPTSAQLEAFRRSPEMPTVLPARTLWSSATLRRDWFETVDFRPHVADCRILALPEEDIADPRVLRRYVAAKQVVRSPARLSSARKSDVKIYIETLCDDILSAHTGAGPTLVIVNRVSRAQELYRLLRERLSSKGNAARLLLVHARFRAAEREALNARLQALQPDDDTIVVATQAVEAGVDVTSRHLFTEIAPWSSLVQRFGRCNRGGEYDHAVVHWMDIDGEADAQLTLPYAAATLDESREILATLDSAASKDLPPVTESHAAPHVLRRKDFLDLFNTEPDLSGFDIDVSPFIRDPGGADVQVFWRLFDGRPDDENRPARREICTISIGAARDHLRTVRKRPWVWNTLDAAWEELDDPAGLRPGLVLMLPASAGGYDAELGFVSGLRANVHAVALPAPADVRPEAMEEEPLVGAGRYVELSEHLLEAHRQAAALAEALPMARAEDEIIEAALWHDIGKAHPAFQTAILEHAGDEIDRSRVWAKSADSRRRLKYGVTVDGELQPRRHFRHELASMLAWLETQANTSAGISDSGSARAVTDTDLVAYLIAAHHGKVRLVLRSLPRETRPPDDRLYARGVWSGDVLPPVTVDGLRVPPLTLRLDLMEIGEGAMGASWSARTASLLERWGPFQLAWLETMVRLADWRASEGVS